MNTRASLNMSLPIRHSVAITVWNGRRQERNSIPVLFSSFFSSTSSFFSFIQLRLMNSCPIRCLALVRSFSSQLFFHVTLTPIYSPGKMLRRSRPDKENSANDGKITNLSESDLCTLMMAIWPSYCFVCFFLLVFGHEEKIDWAVNMFQKQLCPPSYRWWTRYGWNSIFPFL